MARIEYPDPSTLSERTRKALERMPPLNVFRMLSHTDEGLVHFVRWTGGLWTEAELSPRRRELAILLVAQLTNAEYEWNQHVAVALMCDVTQEEIDAIAAGRLGPPEFSDDDAALLAMTRAIATTERSDDATFAAARDVLTSRELVELHLVVGAYVALARLMTNLDLDIDEPGATALVGEKP